MKEALANIREKAAGWAYAVVYQKIQKQDANAHRSNRMFSLLLSYATEELLENLTEGETVELLAEMSARGFDTTLAKKADVLPPKVLREKSQSIKEAPDEVRGRLLSWEQLGATGETIAFVNNKPLMFSLAPRLSALVTGYDYRTKIATLSVLGEGDQLIPFGERIVKGEPLGDILDFVIGTDAVFKSDAFSPSTQAQVVERSLQVPVAPPLHLHGGASEDAARVVFMSYAPTEDEAKGGASSEEFVALLKEHYVERLGLTDEDVLMGFCVPVPVVEGTEKAQKGWDAYHISLKAAHPNALFVSLGKEAKVALGALADASLPHPVAVKHRPKVRGLGARLKEIVALLDHKKTLCDAEGDSKDDSGESPIKITKAAGSKRIVYGVVVDPYEIDTHGDWIPPAEVENMAHKYLAESRETKLQHGALTEDVIVESFVEPYPTDNDYRAALVNAPHSAYIRPYGDDMIKSGSWVVGMRLTEKNWEKYLSGDIKSFSIGARTRVAEVSPGDMPPVKYIELKAGAEYED